jgi:hypothetical protein
MICQIPLNCKISFLPSRTFRMEINFGKNATKYLDPKMINKAGFMSPQANPMVNSMMNPQMMNPMMNPQMMNPMMNPQMMIPPRYMMGPYGPVPVNVPNPYMNPLFMTPQHLKDTEDLLRYLKCVSLTC